MDFNIGPQAALLLGILLQSALQIRSSSGILIMLISMCAACIALYTKTGDGRHLLEMTPEKAIPYGLLYIFCFSFMSREEMLQKITEIQILSLAILFMLGTFSLLTEVTPISNAAKVFALVSVALFYMLSVTKFKLSRILKLICYLVFLAINIILMIMLLSIQSVHQLFNFENLSTINIFLNGVILFSLGTKIVNLALIFPLPTKVKHMRESLELAAEHRNLLISKVHDERIAYSPIKLLCIIFTCVIIYALLIRYVNPLLILQLLLVGSSYFFSYKNKGIISK